jgi:PAS domain S-box-containing protein
MRLRQAVRSLPVEPHPPVKAAVERLIDRQKLPYVPEAAASQREAVAELPLRRMADAAPLLVWTSGPDGRPTFFNSRWLEFRGRRLDEELAEGWPEGVHPEDRPAALRAHATAVGGRRGCGVEYRLRCHDGQYRWILDQHTPHYLLDGTFAGHVCWCLDTTEQKRAEEGARQRLCQLAHVQRVSTLNNMACELAHELAQPVSAIADYARACRHQARALKGARRDEVIDFLGRIAEQADRAAEILRRVRESVRRADCRRQAVDLNNLIRNLAVLLELEARSHKVCLELALGGAPACGSPPKAMIDPIQIQQVITNLVRNALEAAEAMPPQRRTVTIRTSLCTENELEVAVEDSGPGLQPEDSKRWFEPFYTRKPDGLGLGLPISRWIVEAHGGRLEAVPGAEQGTTLRFILPVDGEGGQR